MSIESQAAFVFLALLTLYLIFNRKKLTIQKIFFPFLYFAMWRTTLGLKLMDKIATKWKKTLLFLQNISIFLGFAGMLLIAFSLIQNIYNIITAPEAVPGVGLVLPFEVKGAFFVPFFYWVISIFIIAVVHEFSHGIFARLHNIKVKSSGFAFLGILVPVIPAAFVEPDEKELRKKTRKQQLAVFAGGPFANIVFFGVFLGLFLLISSAATGIVQYDGIEVTGLIESKEPLPAEIAGIEKGEIITALDNMPLQQLTNFSYVLDQKLPGETILVTTNEQEYDVTLVEHPNNASQAYLGVYIAPHADIKPEIIEKYGTFLPKSLIWFVGLLFWLQLLNLGIGLFNLVPIGPIDGGRMLQVALEKYFKKETAHKVWKHISLFFLALVLVNILFAFFK